MNFYIESSSTDPQYNLALEQYVFDFADRRHNYFMLWRNYNSVIVGKNQNTIAEIDFSFVNSNNISVVRRLSGGGAVYHDLGNLNFTFINDAEKENKIDFSFYCQLIKNALVSLGVPAVVSGRNDITAEGRKISGNAQYAKNGRVMHHGTLLYDCNLEMLTKALNVKNINTQSKGIKSVRSRVANIRPFMKEDIPVEEFWIEIKKYLFRELNLKEYIISGEEIEKTEKIKDEIYSKWSWNYGSSPPYNIRKTRRIEGCGNIEILLDIGKEGKINNITFFGDFFGNDNPALLAEMLTGHHFEYSEITNVIKKTDLSLYFNNIHAENFLAVLFE